MAKLVGKYIVTLFSLVIAFFAHSSLVMSPTEDSDLVYSGVLLDDNYIEGITKPEEILGFEVGQRVATPAQISVAIERWSEQSDRLKVHEYARSHEGRPLHAVFISSVSNLERLDEIKADINRLSDGRNTDDNQAAAIIKKLPATAWMSYSIHGNETSGADAALASIYHLIASSDDDVTSMLDTMIVMIDPLMNPDGRDRFAKSLEQYRGAAPNIDDQSLLHTGDWPYGRTNHYFFDLNRDFFFLTQPETRGRVKLINEWRPQLMVDAHEMGPQDTFLMGPPRPPLNSNIDNDVQKWGHIFSKDQGAAFDARGWRYYAGEWFENLYPGYSNYSEYRGSIHILYEQSRMAEDGVRRPEGTVQTYKEAVHHQFVSTMANLATLSNNSQAIYKDFWDGRKYNVSSDSKFANRSYVVLANENKGRINALVDRLQAQDIELYMNDEPFKVDRARLQLGTDERNFLIPAGSLIIPNRQPEAPLISAIMEFDAKISKSVLVEERQNNLKDGSSIMYDTTAWNLTMMYGLPAVTVDENLSSGLSAWEAKTTLVDVDIDANAWFTSGEDDNSVAFAARLMEQDVQVRIVDKETLLTDKKISRGSVFVTAMDNPLKKGLTDLISKEASRLGISVESTSSGYGAGVLPDWGGQHFRLLSSPKIAILSQSKFSSYDVGVSWWGIDHYLGIRHSQLDTSYLRGADLRRYNTIVVPNGYRAVSEAEQKVLSDWVKQGGTLIAHGNSAGSFASENGIGSVRKVQDTFEKRHDYDVAVQREWLASSDKLDTKAVASHTASLNVDYPWDSAPESLSKDELEKRDQWQSRFMPSGAMVAGRVDTDHWLTFGTSDILPLLYANQPVLMTNGSADAVIRVGTLTKNYGVEEGRALNWSTLPAGYDMTVRMSGLVWPEATQRIANSAYLTRERLDKGQVILFSGQPNFRGSTRGTNRLWLNALVYGAGLGASSNLSL